MSTQMTAGDAIGIMDPAFFVSKNELLTWLNTFFQVISYLITPSHS